MFLVRDIITERHERIRGFLETKDASTAVLLAAADFERTIRRAILGLGSSPTADIRKKMFTKHFHGLDKFKDGWNKEVKPRLEVRLVEVIKNWGLFKNAFGVRHKLIHGTTNPPSINFASDAARRILEASREVHDFATKQNVNLDRVIRRYKKR